MAFGTATVTTNYGKGIFASQVAGTTTTPPKFVAGGTGATGAARTAAAADTVLSAELPEGRTSGTVTVVTTTQTGDTFQTVGTITASASRAVDEGGLFAVSTSGTLCLSATFPVVNLLTGDSIQFTGKIQFT